MSSFFSSVATNPFPNCVYYTRQSRLNNRKNTFPPANRQAHINVHTQKKNTHDYTLTHGQTLTYINTHGRTLLFLTRKDALQTVLEFKRIQRVTRNLEQSSRKKVLKTLNTNLFVLKFSTGGQVATRPLRTPIVFLLVLSYL